MFKENSPNIQIHVLETETVNTYEIERSKQSLVAHKLPSGSRTK